MKKMFRRGLATFLVVLMALSSSITALAASVDTDFTLEIKNVNKHFAGMTYTVTATLRNLTSDELTQDEFTWSIDSASAQNGGSVGSISTMNTISDGTYTVSQTASVKLPDSTGTSTVTATFGDYTKTLDVVRLEPIRTIDIPSPQTDNTDYYYTNDGTLYLNSATGTNVNDESTYSPYASLNYSVNSTTDDKINLAISANSTTYYESDNEEPGVAKIRFKSMDAAEISDFILRSSPSGRTEAVVKLIECTKMDYTDFYINKNLVYAGKTNHDNGIYETRENLYTGTSYTVSAANKYPSTANDSIKYTLYNSDKSKKLDCYSIDSKGNCVLNIPDSGDYVLECEAVSKGGYLPRSYKVTMYISAAKPNYISGIALKQVDEDDNYLAADFESTTLYKGSNQAGNNQYNLKKNVKIANTTNYSAEDAVLYESSDPKVATVDANGVVTAVGSGTTTITVYSKMGVDEHGVKTISDTCDITVYQLVDSINISAPSSTLPQGHSIPLLAEVTPKEHDENISWGLSATTADANGNYPLTIQQDGTLTANPQYNFGDKSEVSVDVIATARLSGTDVGEISAKYTIRVIPAVSTKYLQITATQSGYGFLVEDSNGAYSDATTLHQDDNSGSTNITYNGDTFTINGVGYDSNPSAGTANRSTDVYKWTVAYSGTGSIFGDEMTLAEATNGTEANPNKYFKSAQYTQSLDTYSIIPQINGVYRFTCYAVNRGEGIEDKKAMSTFTVKVVYKAKSLTLSTTKTILPVGESITVKTSLDSSDAYKYDVVTYTTVNSTVATVTKAEDYSSSYNVIVTAGKLTTNDYVQAIKATTRSGLTAYVNTKVTENIKNAYIEFVDPTEFEYDGTAKTPAINIYAGESAEEYRLLTKDVDYSIKYYDNINAGVATAEITGKGALEGSTAVVHFTITKKVIGDGTDMSEYLTQSKPYDYYDISSATPTPVPTITLTDTQRSKYLSANVDYAITAINNTTAGVATATVTGIGNYEGSYTFQYNVRDYIINTTVAEIPDQLFTGKALTPEIKVTYIKQVIDENGEIKMENWELVKDTDYTVAYYENINVGEGRIVITGKQPSFRDTKTVYFHILKANLNDTEYTSQLKAATYQITGTNPAPLPTIALYDADRGINLTQTTNAAATGNSFMVSAINNVTAGTATATVTGLGNYAGSYTTEYEVSDDINKAVAAEIPDQIYTGEKLEPELTLTYTKKTMGAAGSYVDSQYTLVPGEDYTIAYSNQTNAGTATITVTGKGNHFYGTKKVTYNIIPIEIESSNATADIEFVTDASSYNKKNYGLLEKNGSTYAYKNDTMTILAVGVDAQGKNTNNSYTWQVKLEDGTVLDLAQPTSNTNLTVGGTVYLTYAYNPNNSVYSIIPKVTGDYTFICTAKDKDNHEITRSKAITVVEPGTVKFANTSATTIPVGGTVTSNVVFDMNSSRYNECTFSSSNENVATVAKNSNYATTGGITVTAGTKIGTTRITGTTRNGATIYFDVVVKEDIAKASITGIASSYPYTGADIRPEPVLTLYGYTLQKGSDYDLVYTDCREAGKATLTVNGKGNDFAGKIVINYTITPQSISNSQLTATVRDQFYRIDANNPAPVPNLEVKYVNASGATVWLNKDVQYTVTCTNNTKAGVATATIRGKGNYSGSTTVKYNVCDDINKAAIATIASQIYSGTIKEPAPVVTYKGTTLRKGVDYNVRYSNNMNVGTATVFIDGISPKFYGTKTATFKINPKKITGIKTTARSASSLTISWQQDPTVTGYQIYDVLAKKVIKTVEGNANVSYKKTSLTAGKEYKYQIRAYTNIYGVIYYGPYSSVHYTYTAPKTPALKLTTTSKTVKATWAKVSGVGGYEIQYSTKSSFSGATKTKLSASATSKKWTGLKKGTTYYVRIRSYKSIKVNGKSTKAYSSWKKLKIKCK